MTSTRSRTSSRRCRLSLVVKGDKFTAAKAAAARGIPFAFKRELARETVGTTSGRQHVKVAQWFAEDSGRPAPFPAGSLLYFREVCE